MAKFKGKFCKKGRDKINKALERVRESRWRQETASAANVVPIISYDHEYAACGIPDPSQQIEIPVDENLKEGEWRVGRRVVKLGILAHGLKSCQLCSQPLHLNDCTGEKKFGLGHMLLIRCNYCQLVNEIPTGSRHKTIAGGIAWDVNTKLAAGMIDAGLGEMHVNSLLSAMNIPTIPPKSIKCREREIVLHLADMAEETCRKNLEEEVRLSDRNLTASFDGAWQKRGTGRAYNSLTGHATLIGESTKNV